MIKDNRRNCNHPYEYRYIWEYVSQLLGGIKFLKTVNLMCGRCGELLESATTERYQSDKGSKLSGN